MKTDTPLVCNMTVFTPVERESHMQTMAGLFQSVQDIQEAENGFEFIFPNRSEIITGLGGFIANERLCCPFLDFTLKVAQQDEPISLSLTGPEGTQDFLRAEFSEAFE